MKFRISRTSAYNKKPCQEAHIMSVPEWHTRTCTEGEFNERFSEKEGLWRSKGRNHKTVNDGKWISRREKNQKVWGIEIDSLDELIIFSEEYGELVLSCGDMPKIEIYDDYRE